MRVFLDSPSPASTAVILPGTGDLIFSFATGAFELKHAGSPDEIDRLTAQLLAVETELGRLRGIMS